MEIDVRHVAKLAKLRLDESEAAAFERQMKDILGMVENLPAVADCGIACEENVMLLRPDVIGQSLSRDEVLENAPQKQAGCIVVPRTV